ncbi:hypothetical protein D3C84_696230 [compost metagenome]
MGVLFVEQQQVEHRDQLRHRQIPRTVGDAAVAQFQQPFQPDLIKRLGSPQERRQTAAEKLQTFYSPANHQESPAFVASHVIQCKPGQRREGHHQAVEKVQQLAEVRFFSFQFHGLAL